ncbi:MAG TPA: hypothetical protein PKA80_07270 [Ignavibacteriaceae bacterium]|nr:hypothetical protein [Ignavibacteriaceae bacterium]
MITLDSVLDEVMQLSSYDRQILVDLLYKRIIEEKRDEIALEIREAKSLYNSGSLNTITADQTISKLHHALEKDE